MSRPAPQLLIISGGSEVAGLALAAAAHAASIPYAVFSLVPRSVLSGMPGCVAWKDLSRCQGNWHLMRDEFLAALAGLSRMDQSRLAILPSEDGSLRLLNECRDDILPFGDFPRARVLRMGGVDKAEVVELAEREGVTAGLAPSRVLVDPDDAISIFEAFGDDAVFKPALKPLDMDMSGMGGHGLKLVTRMDGSEGPEDVVARLRKAWPMSRRWIAQPRLLTGSGLERSVCAVRGNGIHACQVVERAKYPRMGGTAYWVSTEHREDLVPSASRLLEALDVVGICELSYLPDASGNQHLIEFNPRPWLQVGLVERAGFPIVAESVTVLRADGQTFAPPCVAPGDWLQLERMLLALLARQCSLREFGRMLLVMFHKSTEIGGYSGPFPKARWRLAMRSLRKLLGG